MLSVMAGGLTNGREGEKDRERIIMKRKSSFDGYGDVIFIIFLQ